MGVTDLSLSLVPVQPPLVTAPVSLTFLWLGGLVEKLLCSDRDRSLVSFTGLGFFTLS